MRRVFQAVRMAVNEELTALEMLLRVLPGCLNPGGRAAILTFHSGEDRRVKKAFQAGLRDGIYEADCRRGRAAVPRGVPRQPPGPAGETAVGGRGPSGFNSLNALRPGSRTAAAAS